MSNPIKMLNRRTLLPLEHRSLVINTAIPNINERFKKFILEPFAKLEFSNEPSEELVTQYLLNNPDFVESFILKHYTIVSVIEILNKMRTESNDFVYQPNKPNILSQIPLSNGKVNNVIGNGTKPLEHVRQEESDKTEVVENLWTDIQHSASEVNISKERSDRQRQQQSKNDIITPDISFQTISPPTSLSSNQTISFQYLPKMSNKYLVSNLDSDLSIDSKNSTPELLNDMKNDLISILHCDGANYYTIDNINKVIYMDELDRKSVQTIEKGTTLAAFAAYENRGINTPDIMMDDRFPLGILMNNPFIKAAIAQPINLKSGKSMGVLELYRSADKPGFSTKDEEVLYNYVMWAALAIYYNEINLNNQKQQKLNKFLLNVTQKMFGKFKNIDSIIKEIMASAKSLVKADRVSLFLLDRDSNDLFAKIFDIGNFEECIFETKDNVIRFKLGEGIAGIVAETGRTLNIQDAYGDERFNRSIDCLTGYRTKTILCMPVKLKNQVMGVVQMLNKKGEVFTENDEADFETFATYCALALHVSKMYEKILRSQQKYKVALDVLSYHNGYSPEEFERLKLCTIPKTIENLDKLNFWPWTVDKQYQPMYVIYMFKDLFGLDMFHPHLRRLEDNSYVEFDDRFDGETLMRFVLTIKKNYRQVPYHNWNHAFSVAHSMYALLKTGNYEFNIYESLALFIGCLCHDLDHRGKTNEFIMQNSGPLSVLYSTSTMEHHHFNMTVTILQRDGHNIFSHLSPNNYKKVLGHIKHCILATDLTKYFEYRQILESGPSYMNKEISYNRLLHMAVSMTFCDLCSMYKSWDMQLTLVMIIMQEFWTQGDEEKQRGQKPIRMMDRDFMLELPESQVGFLTFVCLPCYRLVSQFIPEAASIVTEAEHNLEKWTRLSKLPASEKTSELQQMGIYVEKVIIDNKLFVR